jgi:hypothetical protein
MRRAFAVDAIFAPEWRVDVIYFAPIDVQGIKTFGPRIRARIKVEMELGVQLRMEFWRGQPIPPDYNYPVQHSGYAGNLPPQALL